MMREKSEKMTTTHKYMLGQFLLLLSLFVLWALFHRFGGDILLFVLILIGLPGIGISWLVVFVHALCPPTWLKLKWAGILLIAAIVVILSSPWISNLGTNIFFMARKAALVELTQDVLAQSAFTDMSPESEDSEAKTRFQKRLIELKFSHFEVHPEYVVYTYGGIIDNCDGCLYVREGHDPPEVMKTWLSCGMLVALKPLGDGWYWFATT